MECLLKIQLLVKSFKAKGTLSTQGVSEIAGPDGNSLLSHSARPAAYATALVLAESPRPAPCLVFGTLEPQGDPPVSRDPEGTPPIVPIGSKFRAGFQEESGHNRCLRFLP